MGRVRDDHVNIVTFHHLSKIVKIDKIVTIDEVFPPSPKIDIPITKATTPHPQKAAPNPASNLTPKKSGRRLTPFFPLFKKIHLLDPAVQKRISIQIFNMNDPSLTYNSRTIKTM